MKPSRKPPAWPWTPVDLAWDEVSLIKAMAAMCPAAFDIVCEKICREKQLSFTVGAGPDSSRATDFAEGKRAVAQNLRAIVKMKMPGAQPKPGDRGPHAVPIGPPPED
jgi:hypothetical protein